MKRAVAVWIVVLAAVPGLASAADVKLDVTCDKYGTCQDSVVVTGGRAEQNDLTVTQDNALTATDLALAVPFDFTINDRSTLLHAGSGCVSLDLYTASCSFVAATASVTVRLGDGNDRLDARALTAPVDVTTGRGSNVLMTGSGNDMFSPGDGENTLDGGAGENIVAFPQATQPVHVDLESSAPQGTTTSRNILRNIQDVQATSSPRNVLLGSDGPNALYAGPDSYVSGRGGNDDLRGGPGSVIAAGDGRDLLSGDQYHPGTPGRSFRCGSGRDTVEASLLDLVSPNCALVKIDAGSNDRFVHLDSTPAANQPFVALRYGCFDPPSCNVELAARLGSANGPLLAHRALHVASPRDGVVEHDYRLILTSDGYARLRRSHHLRVVVYEQLPAFRGIGGRTASSPPDGFTMSLNG